MVIEKNIESRRRADQKSAAAAQANYRQRRRRGAARSAQGSRLGTTLCVPHTCPCGAQVDAYLFIIESCTEHKQNIVNIMVQRSAPSNK